MESLSGTDRWQRLLLVAGGAAATGALIWYLLRESDPEQEEEEDRGAFQWWKVTDAKRANVGLRVDPSTGSDRTGRSLFAGQVFEVSRVETAESDDVPGQQYLRLLDESGWAFTHSSRDGRELCTQVTAEEAEETMRNYNENQLALLHLQEQIVANPEFAAQATQMAQFMQQQQQAQVG
mmetsp:Transcript_8889/g.19911  ORF Transcript_8889/g.19911 Transcript_8889/m.19911 type:complete len:179 (-) Transcript_8889:37-573(-)